MKSLKNLFFLLCIFFGMFTVQAQTLEQGKTDVFPDDGPAAYDASGFTFTDTYVASNSFWASPFDESEVYHARLKYDHPTNSDKSYELRVGKGGHIYSFLTSAGETVPPQYPPHAPWVDEVWQMVAVDGALNDPPAGKKYFIHQAGVYLATPEQSMPFYSPIVAEYFDPTDNSYTIVNWGQQAHTADNLVSGYTSALLYYTRFKNLGNGVIQVDFMMFNFGGDNLDFINIPWGGVRRSTYDHWFSSNPDNTYQEETGVFGDYLQGLNTTGGWAAWSSNAAGTAPTLGLLINNNSGTLRMGDAGTIANRDYTVFEGIQFPGTDLGPGKAIRARNFYLLDSAIDDVKNTIVNDNLLSETFYGPYNLTESEVDGTAYAFAYQGNELIATEVPASEGLELKLRPYQDAEPLFIVKSSSGEYRITTDLYTYSPIPHDGALADVQLLGFRDNPTKVNLESTLICSGESYTFPDGTLTSNITNTITHISDMGTAFNGYDSLTYTTIYVTPVDVPQVGLENNGPGGVGNINGGSSLELWLDAGQLNGKEAEVPADGTQVSQWSDLSGNNQHYTGSGSNRPVYSTSGSFAAVQFNAGTGHFLTGTQEKNHAYGAVFFAFNATDAGNSNPLLSNEDFSLQYEQGTNSGFLGYSDLTGGNDYTSSLSSAFGTDNVVSFHTNCATDFVTIHSGTATEDLQIGGTTEGIPFGRMGTASAPLSGDFYEVVAFKSDINAAQEILVNNYLSAKYGSIGIANDVYDEDESANGDYDYDVAGIGRIDSDNIHATARGTGILTVQNADNLNDGEFLLWGHDGQALDFNITAGVPNYVLGMTQRIWRVSEVNTSGGSAEVGMIDLTFDLSGLSIADPASVVLLIDSNNDGFFADEAVIESSTVNQSDYEGQADVVFSDMDLDDGTRFRLAYLAPDAPGGIHQNLALWLAADGTLSLQGSQLNTWTDKSENKKTATGGLGPTFAATPEKLLNYNPVISFDGSNDNVQVISTFGISTHTDVNIFIVSRLNAAPHQSTIFRESVSGGGVSSHLPWSNGRVFWDAGISSGEGRLHTPSGLSVGDDALWRLSSHDSTTDLQSISKNGAVIASDNSAISIIGTGASSNIGSAGGGLYLNGDIAELIAYAGNDEMTTDEVQKIHSYLALKYGYTLAAGDYINAAGATIWESGVNPAYHNQVIGIGRDDLSDLYQKQAVTRDDSTALYLGTLQAENSQNTSAISDDFASVLLGHNGAWLYDPTAGNNPEKPAGIFARLQREWKITNTNFADTYNMKIECKDCGNFNINDIRLLVDTDGDFSNALIYGSPDVSISEGSIIVSGISSSIVPMNSTRYLTIGSVNPADNLNALPIDLLSFTAKSEQTQVVLNWQTRTEENNDYFTIERSLSGRDWEIISEVDAVGNSNDLQAYEAYDKQPLSGISYYRLKQTDTDGAFTYSGLVTVDRSNKESELSVYPNPTADNILFVRGLGEIADDLHILDIKGEDVSPTVKVNREGNEAKLELGNLPSGTYILHSGGRSVVFRKEE